MKASLLMLGIVALLAAVAGCTGFTDNGNTTDDGNWSSGTYVGNATRSNDTATIWDDSGQMENESASEDDNVVFMENYRFSPETIKIMPGETVTWQNNDVVPHTVTGFGVDVEIAPGQSYMYTFNEEGTFDYICTPHQGQGMVGSVVVSQDADDGLI